MIAFIIAAVSALTPAPAFTSQISPETAAACIECAATNTYVSDLDFDGDGIITTLDAIKIYKQYCMNLENKSAYVFDESDVLQVVEENIPAEKYSEYFYYEIDFIDDEPCREYSYCATEITTAHVYCELNDSAFTFTVSIDPFKGQVSVID